jgi:murein endopeptidase
MATLRNSPETSVDVVERLSLQGLRHLVKIVPTSKRQRTGPFSENCNFGGEALSKACPSISIMRSSDLFGIFM